MTKLYFKFLLKSTKFENGGKRDRSTQRHTCAHEGKKFFAASRLDPVKIRVGIKETADGFNSEREFYLWSELGCSRVARARVRAWGRVCACVRTCLCLCTCVLVNVVLGKKEEAGASIYLVCVCVKCKSRGVECSLPGL